MEDRIARLESDVSHIRGDIGEIKAGMRALRDKSDELKDSLASAKVWALMIAAALLGVLARGFKWI